MTIGKLNVRIGANVKPLGAGLKSASQKLTSFVKRNVSLKKSLLAVAAAGTAAVAAFTAMGIAGIKNGSMLSDLSEKLGINTERLAEFQVRANSAGVEFKQLELGFQRMTRRISEAAQGMGEAQGALKELGLDARELNALSPDQQFERISEAMGNVAGNSDKIRLSFKLFDAEGVNLIRLLNQSAEEAAELNRRTELLGLSLSNVETKQLDKAADALGEMKLLTKGIGNQFGLWLAPMILKAETELFAFLTTAGGLETVVAPGLASVSSGIASVLGWSQDLHRTWIGIKQMGLFLTPGFDRKKQDENFLAFQKLQEQLDAMKTGDEVRQGILDWIAEANADMKTWNGTIESTVGGIDALDTALSPLAKKLQDLDFQTRLAKGQFDAMEKGAAEAAYSMGLMKDLTVDLSTSTAGLTEEQRRLNDAMRKLALVQFENEASLERIEEQAERIKEVGRGIGDEFQNGIEGMISSLGRGEGALESFKRSALNMLSQIGSALASAGLTGLFAAHQANKGSPGLFTGQGLEPSMNLVGAGANGVAPSTSGDTYYMIDARGSESEEILTRKIEGVMQKNEPGIIQKSVTSAREERIRETGTP